MDIVTVLERACERHAERPALSRDETTVSYGTLGQRVPEVAGTLATLGVRPGSTVGICSPDSIEAWLAVFAAWRLGALPALIDARTPDDRLGYFVGDMDPAVVVSDEENRPRLAEILGIDAAPLAEVAAGGAASAPRNHDEASPLFLSYTSGTTGDPKGVVLTSGPVTLGTACIAERLRYRTDDVLVATTPVASSFQLVASAMPALHTGAHVVLAAGHSPREVWEDIAAQRGTVLIAYPLTLADVVGLATGLAPDTAPEHSLRLALSGGSPLAPRIKRDYRDHLGVPLAESYGQSELGGFMVLGTPGDETAPEGFAGRPLPDRLAYVADADNRELSAGAVGEVVVAEGFFGEYRNKPEAYARTTAGGVLHTGDVGVASAQGHIKVMGRVQEADAARCRGGFLREVEDAAYDHPAVRHASVVVDAGERVRCFVELAEPGTVGAEEIAEHLRARVPASLVPAGVHVLATFPRTFSGKADRLSLAGLHGA
ncbi:MAG: acyl--CoA ligase [Acidimicrobiia bacterium]|nr:acyl--CoA ligase [Acidimicrobiia bacterium]MYB25124.1 acyl--CoA ligase [Acidimicrobiia bacterium]MYJ14432.1 acyl--CoA ligase [Acidimicrobiia bacterium]